MEVNYTTQDKSIVVGFSLDDVQRIIVPKIENEHRHLLDRANESDARGNPAWAQDYRCQAFRYRVILSAIDVARQSENQVTIEELAAAWIYLRPYLDYHLSTHALDPVAIEHRQRLNILSDRKDRLGDDSVIKASITRRSNDDVETT